VVQCANSLYQDVVRRKAYRIPITGIKNLDIKKWGNLSAPPEMLVLILSIANPFV